MDTLNNCHFCVLIYLISESGGLVYLRKAFNLIKRRLAAYGFPIRRLVNRPIKFIALHKVRLVPRFGATQNVILTFSF
jgi:hypothetical protein